MAINFPTGATLNQIYTYNGLSWRWAGSYWEEYSIFNVGVGFNEVDIAGITQFTATNSQLLNFSGINLTITSAATNTLVFSAGTGGSGGGVSSLNTGAGLSGNSTTGSITIINTDLGSSQNIFKNIQIGTISQFTADSNNSNLNFSGIGLTITSGSNNTLVFSASPGGVTSITVGSGLSASSTTGNVSIINTQTQGITGITAGYGLSSNTTNNVTTIIQVFDYGKAYTTGNNLNFL